MDKPFVDIVSVFQGKDDRLIEKLSSIYNDKIKLTSIIESLIYKYFNEDNVKHKRLLLKPNWVKHNSKDYDTVCLRTNDEFLLVALESFLKLKPASILIADAPIQGCKWELVVTQELKKKVRKLSEKYGIEVNIKDFRRVVFIPKTNKPEKNRKPLSDYLIFNLGKDSFLEPITDRKKNLFRVADYDPDRLAESHRAGVHKYCIAKEVFDSDIIVSLPKVKTHQKAGLTCALKNLVGVNGDKDYLPHHRIGGTSRGGDCYPGRNIFQYWAELSLDYCNKHQGSIRYKIGRKLTSLLWRMSLPKRNQFMSAGWYGNDTTWRMVLDLNKIVKYGTKDGIISSEPQRQIFSLCDGVVGGQGDGPLNPDPLALGIISLTNDSGANDLAMANVMGLNWKRINMLKTAGKKMNPEEINIFWNNKPVDLGFLKEQEIKAAPPPGWIDVFQNV